MDKIEVYAVVWLDFIPLSLHCSSAAEAIDKARSIRAAGKVRDVRAVHVAAGSDTLTVLAS